MGAREYDPRTAQWLQRDPINAASGDPNLYRYAGNDPINQVDPDGTEVEWRDLLDVAGFIPGVGEVADLVNAGLYALEGDWGNAAISLAGVLLGGDALKAGRLAKKVIQEAAGEGAEQVAKQEAKNALQEQGKKHANRTSGNNSSAQTGKDVHKRFSDEVERRGGRKGGKIPGTRYIADAFDECGRPMELKPNTKRGRQRGREQAQKYADESGKEVILIYYDPQTGEILWDSKEIVRPRRRR